MLTPMKSQLVTHVQFPQTEGVQYTSTESKKAQQEKRENQTKGIMGLFALCSCGEEVKGQICGGNNGTHESLFAAPPN